MMMVWLKINSVSYDLVQNGTNVLLDTQQKITGYHLTT